MKNLLIFAFLVIPLAAFSTETNLEDISKAIGKGDADFLGQYFDENIEISLLEEENILPKAQAVEKIKAFFKNHQPKSFSQIHQGNSKGNDSHYCIGNYATSSESYRVYIYMTNQNNKTIIQEIRFDRQ